MAKSLRFIIALLVVLSAFIIWWWGRVPGTGGADAGVDAGVIMDSGVVIPEPSDAGGADAHDEDAMPGAPDASAPGDIPACGACSYNPTTGALVLQLQKRFTSVEPAFNWNVLGVEIHYTDGTVVVKNVTGAPAPITAADATCGATRNFTVQTASGTNIQAINLRLVKPGSPAVLFKRGCVKKAAGGGIVTLETNCACCGCTLCDDVGTCP